MTIHDDLLDLLDLLNDGLQQLTWTDPTGTTWTLDRAVEQHARAIRHIILEHENHVDHRAAYHRRMQTLHAERSELGASLARARGFDVAALDEVAGRIAIMQEAPDTEPDTCPPHGIPRPSRPRSDLVRALHQADPNLIGRLGDLDYEAVRNLATIYKIDDR